MDGTTSDTGAPLLAARTLAEGADWRVSEFVCGAGPRDRPYEEKHHCFSIAAVVEGSFIYQSQNSRALLHPGALLLGNEGQCYECGHDHSSGDRCIAIGLSPAYFGEIAASAAGNGRYQFSTAMLPAMRELTPLFASLTAITEAASPMQVEETVAHVAQTVLGVLTNVTMPMGTVTARDERRVSEVLRYLEEHAAGPIGIDAMAELAAMSKYHFLRTFRAAVGTSPYQYLLMMRMRRVAAQLATTREPIASIAYDAGFGDLSTFHHRFRDMFRQSPLAYRKRCARLR